MSGKNFIAAIRRGLGKIFAPRHAIYCIEKNRATLYNARVYQVVTQL
jgi:hypothetical protein